MKCVKLFYFERSSKNMKNIRKIKEVKATLLSTNAKIV